MSQAITHSAFNSQLKKYYTFYTGGFIAFLIGLAIAEQSAIEQHLRDLCGFARTGRCGDDDAVVFGDGG